MPGLAHFSCVPRLRFAFALAAVVVAFGWTGCSSTSDSGASATSRATPPGAAIVPALSPVSPSVPVLPRGPRDAYVLLSGGGTPLSNNYSQYLQARAVAAFFERDCPPEATWIFFGVGNREGAAPVLADARREFKRDGLLLASWLPGTLPRNRPATRDEFLRALREEILPRVRDGGTLYLFVGDHGELAGAKEKQESAVTLWQLKKNRRRGDWYTDGKEILGVAELRQVLADGLGRGRVVFGMTQCHSGGFHELGVAREMSPPREWFVGAPPGWAAVPSGPGLRLPVAGFTATDQASPAAGCDPDPDPERWAGYERFLPESLFGLDLMSGQPKGAGVRSLAQAHEVATLVDRTIDKPRATSEHFLEAWARLIETKLTHELRLADAVRQAVTTFHATVDRGRPATTGGPWHERQVQFARFIGQLAEDVPDARAVLLNGTRTQLEAAIQGRGERGGPGRGGIGGRRRSIAELRRAWSETVRPAWKAAVQRGALDARLGRALEFEKRLLKLEDDGRELLLPRGGGADALLNETYWSSGFGEPATFDRGKADAVTRWAASRRAQIMSWARESSDAPVRAAADRIGPGPAVVEEPPRPMGRRIAAERVLFYRRVLAAWEFLVTLRATQPLAELTTLLELERTPWRSERAPVAMQPLPDHGR